MNGASVHIRSASSGAGHLPLPESVVEQAVSWYVHFASGTATSDEREQFARWRDRHADHARAWERLSNMGDRLQGSSASIAPAITHATMAQLAAFTKRRQALKALAWAGTGGMALYLVQDQVQWRGQLSAALADLRTATGESRLVALPDGTQMHMNTATAVDLRFNSRERRVMLREGEIMITTATDAARRPFVAGTEEGDLVPVGTRFTVRRDDAARHRGFTRLMVSEGAVRIHPAQGTAPPVLVVAGQQARYSRDHVEPVQPLHDSSQAWIDGTFAAEGMRLEDLAAELNRYRHGWLRAAPEVADLRITGAWPLSDVRSTERILRSLERRLPVRVRHYTRYWVTIAAR
ncbi:FecR domain-containing protein [Bordetella petrii]|uniref:FecR domain-containing protein n=1 Tax=Bordetella petrii TaxID=94624 RepID=UPI001E2E0AE3|nr:FecR domain-containing protein [Bordetella petrii]MCD0504586.1 FecR domain-containing protein [Bordetella petrii]